MLYFGGDVTDVQGSHDFHKSKAELYAPEAPLWDLLVRFHAEINNFKKCKYDLNPISPSNPNQHQIIQIVK